MISASFREMFPERRPPLPRSGGQVLPALRPSLPAFAALWAPSLFLVSLSRLAAVHVKALLQKEYMRGKL